MHREAWDDDSDWDSTDDEETTIPCPHCGREIYEDSQRCPYCENYLSSEDAPPKAQPWWIAVAVILCLAAMLALVMSGR